MRRPWHERNPERLEEEKRAYHSRGFNFQIKDDVLKKGIVVFEGEVEAPDGLHKLEVLYPSSFPDKPPRVRDLSHEYVKHYEKIGRYICLETPWKISKYGVDKVSEALDFIEKYIKDPYGEWEDESPAAEPDAQYYKYSNSGFLIVPSSFPDQENDSWGSFNIFFLLFHKFPDIIQCLISEVNNISKKQKSAFNVPLALNAFLSSEGTWIKVKTPPPFDLSSFEELRAWMIEKEPKVEHRLGIIKRKQQSIKSFEAGVVGVIYSDQHSKRGDYKDQWLAGVSFNLQGKNVQKLLRPTYLSDGELYYERFKHMREMSKKKVLITGLGAIGSHVSIELTRAGVGNFILVDKDLYDTGNVVRQLGGLEYVGFPKVEAILVQMLRINPEVNTQPVRMSVGEAYYYPAEIGGEMQDMVDTCMEYDNLIKDCDLVISTIAENEIEFLINEMALEQKKPAIYAYTSNGAWGGRIFVSRPGEACFQCLVHYEYEKNALIGEISQDPAAEESFVTGCNSPTFQGVGFDTSIISNLASRLAVQALFHSQEGEYPDSQ